MSTGIPPLFFTRAEAAEACRVSEDVIAAAIHSGKLRAKRTGANGGGKFLLSPDALRDWFESLIDA